MAYVLYQNHSTYKLPHFAPRPALHQFRGDISGLEAVRASRSRRARAVASRKLPAGRTLPIIRRLRRTQAPIPVVSCRQYTSPGAAAQILHGSGLSPNTRSQRIAIFISLLFRHFQSLLGTIHGSLRYNEIRESRVCRHTLPSSGVTAWAIGPGLPPLRITHPDDGEGQGEGRDMTHPLVDAS
jgi:hypothetical protein